MPGQIEDDSHGAGGRQLGQRLDICELAERCELKALADRIFADHDTALETLTREDFAVLLRGEKLPPRPPAPPVMAPASVAPIPVAEPRRTPPLLGGPEVAPA